MPFGTNRIFINVLFTIFILFSIPAKANQTDGVTLKTVVIDPGHGGHDYGAISKDKKLNEKDVVLDVALTLGKKIKEKYPKIKVIYTRSKDVYIPLDERTIIANKNHADLFISIHCNSVPKKSNAPSGSETYVMGVNKSASNMDACKIENSVVLLENDYSAKYQGYDPDNPESFIFFNLMQNAHLEQSIIMAALCQEYLRKGPIKNDRGIKQGALLVLWKTTMPAVLVELGFISNQHDRNILGRKEDRNILADRLFCAFEKFREQYETNIEGGGGRVTEDAAEDTSLQIKNNENPKQESVSLDKDVSGSYYTIQILSVAKKLSLNAPDLKGEKNVDFIISGGLYKYSVGKYSDREEAKNDLQKVRRKFSGAFIIKIEDGEIVKNR